RNRRPGVYDGIYENNNYIGEPGLNGGIYNNRNRRPGVYDGIYENNNYIGEPGLNGGIYNNRNRRPGVYDGIYNYRNEPGVYNDIYNNRSLNNKYQNMYDSPRGVPLLPMYGYDSEVNLNKDYEYMKQLYPNTARSIYSEVVRECNRLDYDGSIMYEDYPEKTEIEKIINRVYDRVKNYDEKQYDEHLHYHPRKRENHLRDIVTLVLLCEMLNRRSRYRSMRRWF
ncbi:hypothetical protein I5677_01840, partial [Mobilitalea sibirica]